MLAGDEASCSRSFHPGIGAAGRSHADARGRTPERNVTMVSKEEFDKAAEEVKAITKCTNDEQLELYGWFKQANVGDCNIGSRPAPGAVRARSALRSTPLARSFRPSRARSRVMWRAPRTLSSSSSHRARGAQSPSMSLTSDRSTQPSHHIVPCFSPQPAPGCSTRKGKRSGTRGTSARACPRRKR